MEVDNFGVEKNFIADMDKKRELALQLIKEISQYGYPKQYGTELVNYLEYQKRLRERREDRRIHTYRFNDAKVALDRVLGYFKGPVVIAFREAQLAEERRQFAPGNFQRVTSRH